MGLKFEISLKQRFNDSPAEIERKTFDLTIDSRWGQWKGSTFIAHSIRFSNTLHIEAEVMKGNRLRLRCAIKIFSLTYSESTVMSKRNSLSKIKLFGKYVKIPRITINRKQKYSATPRRPQFRLSAWIYRLLFPFQKTQRCKKGYLLAMHPWRRLAVNF